MNIGHVSRQTRVSTKTIRYYESIGVLPEPLRESNGYRSYEQATIDRLRFVKDAQATGLSLTEISSILDLREHGAQSCEHVAHLLSHHVADLEQRIAALEETRRELARIAKRASQLDPADCTDPNRCQTIASDMKPLPAASEIHGAAVSKRIRTH